MQVYFTSQEIRLLSQIWYLKCGQRWMGPYSYPELSLMILSKSITRHQYVRSNLEDNWKKITEYTCFSQKFIENFLYNYSPRKEIAQIRSHIRIELQSHPIVIIHNGKVLNAKCLQLSAGGARVEIPYGEVALNDEVKVHVPFNSKFKLKSFNSRAVILRQEKLSIVDGKNHSETFSIQFVGIRAKYKKQILRFVQKKVNHIYRQMKTFEALESQIDFVNLGLRRSDFMRVNSEDNPIILAG